jgi:DNA-3-methyladenine glycosylase II
MASTTLEFRIQPRPPFAFALALAYLRASPSSIVEVIGKDTYRRAIRLGGRQDPRPALLTVREGGLAGLQVTVTGPSVVPDDRPVVESLVRRLFRVDDDVVGLDDVALGDPVFAAIARACRGLRPVIIPDLFEAIVWAILGQQVNIAFAAKIKRGLVDRFGERFVADGRDFLLFPRPERLAAVSETELAEIQLSRQKIRYVLGVASDVSEGRLDLDELARLPSEEAQARLESVLGIGRWTAEYVLMRGLGCRDVIPAADGGLRRIIGYSYGLGRSASEAEVRERAEYWVGWRGYAAFYWWFTLQQGWVATPPLPQAEG